jgi:hypothetical protein
MEDAMTCDEYKELASAWFDAEEWDAFPELLKHVAECERCRLFLARLPRQSRLVHELHLPDATASNQVDASSEFPPLYRFLRGHIRAPLAAAAAIILVLLTLAVEQNLTATSSHDHNEWETNISLDRTGGRR